MHPLAINKRPLQFYQMTYLQAFVPITKHNYTATSHFLIYFYPPVLIAYIRPLQSTEHIQ